MFDKKVNRLDSWNKKKKVVDKRININYKKDGTVKFRIRPWSIWWFEVGENIGSETSCHYSIDRLSTLRPCVIISNNNFNHATYNKKVIVMPITSKKNNSKIKHFHHMIKAEDYKYFVDSKNNIEYKGLEKDSLIICNDIKTIDTKRLNEPIYSKLKTKDILEVQKFMKKYLSLFSA